MSFLFRDQSWLLLQEYLKKRTLLILPVGTTEEHGPHLPVDTDARIAEAYGTRLAATLVSEIPVLLLDTIRYGYSMKIMRQWPGTIIVRSRVFMDMVFDICRSVLDMGFEKLAILDCHGHHSGPLNTVSREICDACDKAIAIISPAALSRDEFNAVRKSPREVPSTPASGKLPCCFTSVQRWSTCRKQRLKTSCVITLNSSLAIISLDGSASPGPLGTFRGARQEPMATPPSPAPRQAKSLWTLPSPTVRVFSTSIGRTERLQMQLSLGRNLSMKATEEDIWILRAG